MLPHGEYPYRSQGASGREREVRGRRGRKRLDGKSSGDGRGRSGHADRLSGREKPDSGVPCTYRHEGGIEKLRQIKPFNKYVHIETTSPYLAVTSEQFDGPLYKMEPPLRNQEDKNALWEALDDGVIEHDRNR